MVLSQFQAVDRNMHVVRTIVDQQKFGSARAQRLTKCTGKLELDLQAKRTNAFSGLTLMSLISIITVPQ